MTELVDKFMMRTSETVGSLVCGASGSEVLVLLVELPTPSVVEVDGDEGESVTPEPPPELLGELSVTEPPEPELFEPLPPDDLPEPEPDVEPEPPEPPFEGGLGDGGEGEGGLGLGGLGLGGEGLGGDGDGGGLDVT